MARLFLSAGQEFGTIGPFTPATEIFGTNSSEKVTVESDGKAIFDPSFNRGGDEIVIQGNSADYSGIRAGSSLLITSSLGASITIPVGTAGVTITFENGSFTLAAVAGVVKLGAQEITATAVDLGNLGTPLAQPAAALSFALEDGTNDQGGGALPDQGFHSDALFVAAPLGDLLHDVSANSQFLSLG